MARIWLSAAGLLMSGVTHCALAADVSANFAPNDPPGEWHSQARDYANTRFSPLDEINAGNVKQLSPTSPTEGVG
jgi:glucose dehydrogenase